MHFPKTGVALFQAALLATLAACGGGGGGGSSAPVNNNGSGTNAGTDGSWLTFSPSPLQATTFEGESVSVNVIATATRQFSKPFNIAIIDSKGVIQPAVSIAAMSASQYQATLATAPQLGAGAHATSLQVRVCEDDPAVCKLPLPGSPWSLPMTVNVKTKAEAAARLTITPAAPVIEAYPGEAVNFSIEGKWTADVERLSKTVVVSGASELLEAPATVSEAAGFKTTFRTKAIQAPGVYTGVVNVRACYDAPAICANPVSGSPWPVTVTIKVSAAANLAPLKPIAQLGAWSTERGNAAHTASVPATFTAAHFSRRWTLAGTGFASYGRSLANDNGRVFAVRYGSFSGSELVAIDEATGAYAWRLPLGAPGQVMSPAAANGRVYVKTQDGAAGKLWVVNQADGSVVSKVDTVSLGSIHLAPVPYGADVYLVDGIPDGVSKFGGADYARAWTAAIADNPMWNPSVDAGAVYVVAGGALHAGATDTGARIYSIATSNPSTSGAVGPVLGENLMAFATVNSQLVAFDLAGRKLAWSLGTDVLSQPAYAKGVVYVVRGSEDELHAYAADTGNVMWTVAKIAAGSTNPTSVTSKVQVLVTDNLAFIGGSRGTFAVDLATRKTVWSYPVHGDLSISQNGVLYILPQDGSVHAVNLKQ